jgi:hypothetical protein
MVVKQMVALAIVVMTVLVGMTIAIPISDQLGSHAKDSAGSDDSGQFNVDDSTIDKTAEVSLVWVPTGLIVGMGAWAFLSLFAVLAYLGGA